MRGRQQRAPARLPTGRKACQARRSNRTFTRRASSKLRRPPAPRSPRVGLRTRGACPGQTIKLGYVSPQTGRLRLRRGRQFRARPIPRGDKGGLKVGNATRPVEVLVRDSQSNPNRAAEVAKELIVRDKVDLMLVASTPETTNPVCTQCEIEEVACVSTKAPWQPWFIGQQANPGGGPPAWKPFNYVYHYFWGLEDVIAVFTNMWSQVADQQVGRRPVPQ